MKLRWTVIEGQSDAQMAEVRGNVDRLQLYQWIGWIAWALVFLATLAFAYLQIPLPPIPPFPEDEVRARGVTNLNSLTLSDDLIVADDLTVTAGPLDVDAGGATIAGGVTVEDTGLAVTAGGMTLSDGDLVVADDIRTTAQTGIVVTNGAAFTPTGTYQPISAAGEVTPTITAGATAGDLLVLVNTGSNAINLADSGTLMLTAAAALGQYDTLILWSDGTNWIEVSRANN